MKKTINVTFSKGSIKKAVFEVYKYSLWLEVKCQEFCDELANKGLQCAKSNQQGLAKYVTFSVKQGGDKTSYLVAVSTSQTVVWYDTEGNMKSSSDFSPVLMAEFGSGKYAIEAEGEASGLGGRGTYPNQTHAFQTRWNWYDAQGNVHWSAGYKPVRPLSKATLQMYSEIYNVASQVFGS